MSKSSQKYALKLTNPALKQYEGIRDFKLLRGINRVLDEIKEDPYQFKKLSGPLAHLRAAKTFSFRILYLIENEKLLIWIIEISNRKNAYR